MPWVHKPGRWRFVDSTTIAQDRNAPWTPHLGYSCYSGFASFQGGRPHPYAGFRIAGLLSSEVGTSCSPLQQRLPPSRERRRLLPLPAHCRGRGPEKNPGPAPSTSPVDDTRIPSPALGLILIQRRFCYASDRDLRAVTLAYSSPTSRGLP